MALENISHAVSILLMCSLFLAFFAGASHAVNGCATIGSPNCANINKVCCTNQGDPGYDKCVSADDLCVTSCGEEIAGSGSCNPQGNPSSFDECSAIEHASCCGMADGCVWDSNGCHMEAAHYSATIMCSLLNDKADGCGAFEDIQACSWSQSTCAQSSQVCGASSPLNLPCCPGAGACSLVGSTWKCACPGVGGDCSSNACCSGLTCQSSNNLCCYSTGGSCTVGGGECCSSSACVAGTCKSCSGPACASASDCCAGYACELKGAGKQCCIADNSATQCNYGSDCCSGFCTGHACQPAACEVVPTIPSYTDVTLDPKYGLVNTFTYNLSEKDYVKTGIPNALLFMVNLSDQTNIKICYQVTNSTGHSSLAYDPSLPGCTDYWFIFCPDGKGTQNDADGLKARETCLNSTKINYGTLIYPVPAACGGTPPAPKSYLDHILSHNELYFCNKVTKDYAPLCWPLMLILGLLLGASFAAGKNPFHAFDLSSPRMNRGRQYSMRVQNKSFDLLSYIMGAATTAMSAKSLAKALKKGGGGFGAMLKREARSAFNPSAAIKDLKSGLADLKGAIKTGKSIEVTSNRLANKAKGGSKKAIERYDAYSSKVKADASRLEKTGNADAKALAARYRGIIAGTDAKVHPTTSSWAPQQSLPGIAGIPGVIPNQPVQSTQMNMVLTTKGMVQQSGRALIQGIRRQFKIDKKKMVSERKENVAALKQDKKDIRKGLKEATPEDKAKLKQGLNVARLERSQAKGWKLGAEEPKSVKQLTDEAQARKDAAVDNKDKVAERAADAELASLGRIGQTRAQFRLERQKLVAKKQARLVALEKESPGDKKAIKQAKIDLYRAKNWVHGTSSPQSIEARREAAGNDLAAAQQQLKVATEANDSEGIKSANQGMARATQEISYLKRIGMSGKELRAERKEGIIAAKNDLSGQDRRAAISEARNIGRLPSMGTSGATASAYGARDTIGTIASLFKKDTWNAAGRENKMAASGGAEYFEYAKNASSDGQAFLMLLQFALKKMMENAKLRDRDQQGYRLQTSLNFRTVTGAIKTLFRVYSVMSVLSAYTKGLGAATGSGALKGGIGFMETINSAGFGSIGKYNINAASLASWLDPSLSQQMVGGGLPYPFNQLQGVVSGAVAGGGVLVQKFSDLLGRDIRLAYTEATGEKTSDGKQTFVLATEGNGTLKKDKQGNYLVEKCIGKDGQLIEGYADKPLQISSLKRTYVVVKDGNYLPMGEREATRYDRTQADRAKTLAEGNAYALKVGGFFTGKKVSAEVKDYLNKQTVSDADIAALSDAAKKAIIRSSRQNALELLSRLPDMSGMSGEEQMKILNLRSTLETHAAFTGGMLDLIRAGEATPQVMKLIQEHQTRDRLQSAVNKQKEDLAVLEKQKADNTITEEGRTLMVGLEENARRGDMALGLFNALNASGLDVDKDIVKNIGAANKQMVNSMMRALDFQDSYAKCYSAATVMGLEDRMPDIATFQQKGADALKGYDYSLTLGQMADQLSAPANVRFRDRQASDNYRKSLSGVMDAGQEYLTTQTLESKRKYADALTNNELTLLESVKFDGRFAEKQNEIVQKLSQASKLREENLDSYIQYVDKLASTTVALHQTSDSYISAQMAKTGWQDRAPYQSSPETDALLSTQASSEYVQGARPSMTVGLSSPTWFGSNSDALYMKGAEFVVPPVDLRSEQEKMAQNIASTAKKGAPALEKIIQSDTPLPEGITKDQIKQALDEYKRDPTNPTAQFGVTTFSFITDNSKEAQNRKKKSRSSK